MACFWTVFGCNFTHDVLQKYVTRTGVVGGKGSCLQIHTTIKMLHVQRGCCHKPKPNNRRSRVGDPAGSFKEPQQHPGVRGSPIVPILKYQVLLCLHQYRSLTSRSEVPIGCQRVRTGSIIPSRAFIVQSWPC